MSLSRVIEVSFGGGSIAYAKVDTAYFYNNGILFKPTDLDLPASYQVHWADSPQASSTLETIGTAEGAPIPDDLWNRSRVIYGWIYLHPTEDSGVTGYEVRIYKNVRAGLPDGTEPTPAEQSTIDQLIGALNTAVEQTGQDAESASQSAQSAESAKTAAESARDTAGEYANDAESSAASASTSASQASTSATASAESASQSAQIKAGVEDLVDDAQGHAESASQSASASAQSASASANSASDAQGYANSASASAQSASGYASNAQTSANTASTKATEASTSAQTASQKATEASQSASQALSYKTDAESAKTASQTAQGLAESARDTAVSAKTDAESARDDAVQAKEDAESAVASIADALTEKAPIITDTASGAIASFSDGADDLPLKSLVVDINPVQDLHGQDAPYPAGGGKNLCSDIASDYTKPLNYWVWHRTLTDGTYYISVTPKSGAETGYVFLIAKTGDAYAEFDGTITFLTTAGETNNRSFTVDSTWTNPVIGIYCPSGKTVSDFFANYIVQLEKNATATAFAPYENICPISGWAQVGVEQSGVNLFDGTFVNMAIASAAIAFIKENPTYRGFYARIKGGQTYTVSRTVIETNRFRIGASVEEPSDGVEVVELARLIRYDTEYAITVTVPDGYNYLFVYLSNQSDTCTSNNYQMQIGSTATPYEPYTGRSITINLGQTVYGGKLDVLSGELTIDRAMVDLGTLNWEYQSSYQRFRTAFSSAKQPANQETAGNGISSIYTMDSMSNTRYSIEGIDGVIAIGAVGYDYLYAVNVAYTDAATFKTAMSGVQLCYELATPLEIQLDAHAINSLYGVNNIWADSGDTEVVYRADTKLFIERLTAPDSADMIADSNITSGQYFMVGNTLYKATSNIANGSAIIVGTNAVRKSLSEALNEINA